MYTYISREGGGVVLFYYFFMYVCRRRRTARSRTQTPTSQLKTAASFTGKDIYIYVYICVERSIIFMHAFNPASMCTDAWHTAGLTYMYIHIYIYIYIYIYIDREREREE